MKYPDIERSRASKTLLEELEPGYTIYVVREKIDKEFNEQWVRFYHVDTDSELSHITDPIAVLQGLNTVNIDGLWTACVRGVDDGSTIKIVDQIAMLLFQDSSTLVHCRL